MIRETDMCTKSRFVAMLDIMGFKSIVEKRKTKTVYNLLNSAYIEAKRQAQSKRVQITMFSDTIIVVSEDDSIDSYSDVVLSAAFFQNLFIKKGYAINGAIAFGDVTYNEEKNICFGKPIADAHILQEELFFYGMVLHESAQKRKAQFEDFRPHAHYRPDLVIDLKVPLKKGGWETYYCVNWCEAFCDYNAPHKEQVTQIKGFIEKLYQNNKPKESKRGIYYIQNTEIVLKQWYDYTDKVNHQRNNTWGELLYEKYVTKSPDISEE